MAPKASTQRELSFKNQFMFNRVMANEPICKAFLELVLEHPIDQITYKNAEQSFQPKLDARGVRLDLFARAGDDIFDIELQASPWLDLPRRCRYYQAAIDTASLEQGEDFDALPESYIIFVCDFDPIGAGRPCYTMERACLEDPSLDVADGAHWIALSCPAYEKADSAELRAFLKYVSTGKIDASIGLVSDIADAVAVANEDRKWVSDVFSVDTMQGNLEREIRMTQRKLAKVEKAYEEAEARAATAEAQAEARYSALVDKLLDAGRLDDLKRASSDDAFRERLYTEFKL